ncbi:MAG: squalene-hopene/tetraprenyl-beta-curcumene cyclase [Gammaproteobacteria bacterium]|jgi:squalene-hopene/tetraprenyl-beta-curcumene cyclase
MTKAAAATRVDDAALKAGVERATTRLLADQTSDGFWCYEFEADCTIPAEYILLAHFTGEAHWTDGLAPDLEEKVGNYLRERQLPGGGWPLYFGGAMDISCSVKAYYALKLIGDSPDAVHMVRARDAILSFGGALEVNVFTRITLALFGQLTWRAVPVVPVEIMLFPRWAPVHLSKVSYWSRAVTVPLAVLCSLKPQAVNPLGIGVAELFTRPPEEVRPYFKARSGLSRIFIWLDAVGRRIEPHIPAWVRARALRAAKQWTVERRNGVDGLGAIFPAMVNAYQALGLLGFDAQHRYRRETAEAIKRLVVVHATQAYCQPCVSPIWDTGLACLALEEVGNAHRAGEPLDLTQRDLARHKMQDGVDASRRPQMYARTLETGAAIALDAPKSPHLGATVKAIVVSPGHNALLGPPIQSGLDWTVTRQLTDEPGDWQWKRPSLPGGGWPFEFANPHYPDVDDTAVLGWVMQRVGPDRYQDSIARAAAWVAGMQSTNGGFSAFDVDNSYEYLNEVPFADHGALLDPPTSDVTARCIAFLTVLDRKRYQRVLARALAFLIDEQEPEGCWYGRWGTNYIYGTWSVLAALEIVHGGVLSEVSPHRADGPAGSPAYPSLMSMGQRAGEWLLRCQREDGGWGESNDSYADRRLMGQNAASTSFHTAWAMLGLAAAGLGAGEAATRGAQFLLSTQRSDGHWYDDEFSCPGFPRVFYLKYHGYSKYFPLWALARFRRDSACMPA